MLVVNADDFGRSREETDAVVSCFTAGRVTSATAMVFMQDSDRAAGVAKSLGLDVGLHINLSEAFSGPHVKAPLQQAHAQVARFMTASKYSVLVYNPFLRRQFQYEVEAQIEEFVRLFGRQPSHIDGHRHHHLSANLMIDGIIPAQQKVRRNFSFWPGEKSGLNRGYRGLVDWALARNHVLTDFFFSLEQCLQTGRMSRVFHLAETATVELMTHPLNPVEFKYLMSDECLGEMKRLSLGNYAAVCG